jgi:Heavy metal associated domain 2
VSSLDPDPDGPPLPPERLTLVHHHPGRLRVRADAFREALAVMGAKPAAEAEAVSGQGVREPTAFDRVRAALDAEPGITEVVQNARTGSVLIEYQAGLTDSETILSLIAHAAGLEMPSDEERAPKKPAIVAIDVAREVNELVADVTGQQLDMRSLVPIGMAALGAYSFMYGKEARLPRWDNLLWWSYSIFTQLHRREIERGEPTLTEP